MRKSKSLTTSLLTGKDREEEKNRNNSEQILTLLSIGNSETSKIFNGRDPKEILVPISPLFFPFLSLLDIVRLKEVNHSFNIFLNKNKKLWEKAFQSHQSHIVKLLEQEASNKKIPLSITFTSRELIEDVRQGIQTTAKNRAPLFFFIGLLLVVGAIIGISVTSDKKIQIATATPLFLLSLATIFGGVRSRQGHCSFGYSKLESLANRLKELDDKDQEEEKKNEVLPTP